MDDRESRGRGFPGRGGTSWLAWALLLAGVALAGLTSLTLRSHSDRTRRVESLVAERTGQLTRANALLEHETAELRMVEKRLREGEERFRSVFESTSDGIIVWSVSRVCLYANAAAERQLGAAGPGLIESDMTVALGHLPDLLDVWSTAVDAALATGVTERREHTVKADGRRAHLEAVFSPIRDGEARTFAVSVVYRDRTERQALAAQLAQSRKLESVGQLAAGVAHEINTPIQYVSDNVRFLEGAFADQTEVVRMARGLIEEGPDPSHVEALASALEAADVDFLEEEVPGALTQSLSGLARIAEIVLALKAFSHPGTGEKEPIDLNSIVRTAMTVSRNEWKYVAETTLDLAEDLPTVPGLSGPLNQAVLNLIVNAAHAIADSRAGGEDGEGRITLSTRATGDTVEVLVADDGAGIPENIRTKVFDPFFTTKEVGRGTGQGLSLVHSVVVEQHGGEVEIQSEVGAGTTMILRLPRRTDPATVGAASG